VERPNLPDLLLSCDEPRHEPCEVDGAVRVERTAVLTGRADHSRILTGRRVAVLRRSGDHDVHHRIASLRQVHALWVYVAVDLASSAEQERYAPLVVYDLLARSLDSTNGAVRGLTASSVLLASIELLWSGWRRPRRPHGEHTAGLLARLACLLVGHTLHRVLLCARPAEQSRLTLTR